MRNDASDPESVRRHLDSILASATFQNAARLRRFLKFAVEKVIAGEGEQVKEYLIGVEVFDRNPSFDPRTDSVVRVEARRLREKLGEFYRTEGASSGIVISLPKGSYVPVFEQRAPSPASKRRFARVWPAAAVLVLAAAAVSIWLAKRSAPEPAMIAILPFDSLSGDREVEYFAHGLTEELTAALSKLDGVRVVARATALQLKQRRAEWPGLPRRLGIRTVVDGSVRKSGARLRISASITSVPGGYSTWSETYERGPEDAFLVQDEIARAVAGALSVRAAPPMRREPADPETRMLYWRAQYARNERNPGAIRRAAELFDQATARDPRYAMAWAGAAEAYATLAFHQLMPGSEAVAKAKSAAAAALEIDDSRAEARAALGWIAFFWDRDWIASEREFRRALAINPSYAGGHQLYALGLMSRRRFEEAAAESRKALELNPLFYLASNELAVVLFCGRKYDEAIRIARRTLELQPDYSPARIVIGMALAQQGKFPQSLAEFESVLKTRRDADVLGRFGHALALAGRSDQARRIASEMEGNFQNGQPTWVHLAFVYTGLGDRDRAFECIEKSYRLRETDLNFLDADPTWDPIRADPRFEAMRARVGLAALF